MMVMMPLSAWVMNIGYFLLGVAWLCRYRAQHRMVEVLRWGLLILGFLIPMMWGECPWLPWTSYVYGVLGSLSMTTILWLVLWIVSDRCSTFKTSCSPSLLSWRGMILMVLVMVGSWLEMSAIIPPPLLAEDFHLSVGSTISWQHTVINLGDLYRWGFPHAGLLPANDGINPMMIGGLALMVAMVLFLVGYWRVAWSITGALIIYVADQYFGIGFLSSNNIWDAIYDPLLWLASCRQLWKTLSSIKTQSVALHV